MGQVRGWGTLGQMNRGSSALARLGADEPMTSGGSTLSTRVNFTLRLAADWVWKSHERFVLSFAVSSGSPTLRQTDAGSRIGVWCTDGVRHHSGLRFANAGICGQLLHVNLFSIGRRDGFLRQLYEGSSACPLSDALQCIVHHLSITDSEDREIAKLEICCEKPNVEFNVNPPVLLAPQPYLDYVANAYQSLTLRTRQQYFSYVKRAMGRLPMLAFVMACRFNEFTHESDRLISTILRSARHLTTADSPEALLNEASTVVCRALIYELDNVRLPKDGPDKPDNKRTPRRANREKPTSDYWLQPSQFPHPGIAAYDCDDGAGLTLETIQLLKQFPVDRIQDPKDRDTLVQLKEALKGYTPCLALGDLRLGESEQSMTPHAYSMLVDSNYFEGLITGERIAKYKPLIVLESTNWTQGVRDRTKVGRPEMQQIIYQSMKALIFELSTAHPYIEWDKMIKYRMPLEEADQIGLYGTVTALLTADHQVGTKNPECCHLLLHDQGKVGVSLRQLENHDAIRGMTPIRFPFDSDQFKKFRASFVDQVPPSTMFVKPHRFSRSPELNNPSQAQLILRSLDWHEYGNEIEQALERWKQLPSNKLSVDKWRKSTVEFIRQPRMKIAGHQFKTDLSFVVLDIDWIGV